MRKFQILVIAHCLNGNKIANSNDIVSESQLTSPADDLIAAGFIKEIFEDVNDIPTVEVEEVVESEATPEAKAVAEDVKKEIKDIKAPKKRN